MLGSRNGHHIEIRIYLFLEMVTHESSLNSVFSMDSYKYKTDIEMMREEIHGDKMFDYEKLMREECDCSKRKIPGLSQHKTQHLISILPPTNRQFI